jgi:DNA-binding beta-propeller fold protein YncE
MRRLGAALGLALVISAVLPGAIAADSVVSTWQVGEEPFGIVVDPSDGRIFVANSRNRDGTYVGPGSITVVNPTSPLTRTIVTSGPSDLLAVDAGHRRLYSSNADHSLQVFDLDTLGLIARLPVGGLGLAVDPSAQRIYVADYAYPAGSFVTVIDGTTNTVVQTKYAPKPENWWGLALDTALHHLYVTNINYSWSPTTPTLPSLVVLDDRDLSLVSDIQLPVVPRFAITVDQTQHRVHLGAGDPNGLWDGSMFFTIDGVSFATLSSISVPGFPTGVALDADAHRIYLTDSCRTCQFHGYRVLDDRTFAVVQTAATPWLPGMPLVHPDGRLYMGAWNNFADEVVAIHLGNSAPQIFASWFTPAEPKTNEVLLINVGATDPDFSDTQQPQPVTLAYEWLRNGVVIPSANGASLDLAVPGHGDRGDTITVRVTASDGQATSAPTAVSVVVADTAPVANSAALPPFAPRTNDTITATATASDADADPLTYTFTWKVDGLVRAVTSGPNPSSSFDLAVAGNGDRGQTVLVEVVAADGALQSGVVSASTVVANSPPAVTVSLSETSPQGRDVLVATAVAQDADSDPLTVTYTWTVNGVVRQTGASNRFDLAVKGNGDNGDVVSVTATVSDGTASVTASASATVTQKRH